MQVWEPSEERICAIAGVSSVTHEQIKRWKPGYDALNNQRDNSSWLGDDPINDYLDLVMVSA